MNSTSPGATGPIENARMKVSNPERIPLMAHPFSSPSGHYRKSRAIGSVGSGNEALSRVLIADESCIEVSVDTSVARYSRVATARWTNFDYPIG